jgi:glycosyltransferase involved in cell wall biosynthesis
MILKGYPRISETFISNEILLLERLGFNIHLFSMRQPREPFCHESVKQIRARVDYLPEELLRPLPLFLWHNFQLVVKKPRNYWKAVRMALRRFMRTRKMATLKHLLQAGYLVQYLLPGSGVTHLHAHFAHSPTSVALFAAQLSGLPFSFTGHAKDVYTSDARQLGEKIQMARFVLTCTEYNRRYLNGLRRGASTPILRVYHGIDLELFSDRGEKPPERPYRIITVARITAKKGLPAVYHALRDLKNRGISFQHTLIGDGEDREKILQLIRELGLEQETRWLGTLPHHEVLMHYRVSDLFVLGCEVLANGDRDGIPNVLVESMAIGVPVVATRISAIPELVADGETGLLVAPGDPRALADAMVTMLTDTNLRKRIIPKARQRVKRNFDNTLLIREIASIYRYYGIFPSL